MTRILDLRDNEVYEVWMETETEVYFFNADDRWCYFDKEEIGEAFVFTEGEKRMKVWDFMPEFVKALTEQLESDDQRWGDTWRRRVRMGHEDRIFSDFSNYYDQWKNGGKPIPWLKIAGLAMIAWIRETQEGWAIEE